MNNALRVSVIVPVHNARHHLDFCLNALLSSDYTPFEVICVDDASTDESAAICRGKGVKVFQLERQSGPGAARNHGARKATGEILFFVDSDVVVRPWTIAHVARRFRQDTGIVALFGSYDDAPHERNFFSQYKNLYHHFVHQQSSAEAATFWAGCGAIRREAFEMIGGFDQRRYPRPSIEDIDLGIRLREHGWRILLDKELQVKHLKRWTLNSMTRADVFLRALPWSRLLLEKGRMIDDLNLRMADKVSAAMVGLSLLLLLAMPLLVLLDVWLLYAALMLAVCLMASVLWLNRKLYLFFARVNGYGFAAAAFPVQLLYYFYSGTVYLFCWCEYRFGGKRSTEAKVIH